MRKLILLLILSIFLLSFVSSQQIYKQSTIIDLKVPFIVDGRPANNTAICNISIKYPNSTYLIQFAEMTNNNNGDFNYTLNTDQTNLLGVYNWNAYCCDSTQCASGYGNFEINKSGFVMTTGDSIFYFLMTGFVFILFMLVFVFMIKVPYSNKTNNMGNVVFIERLKYLKLVLIAITYGLFVWFLNLLLGISNNFINLGIFYGFIQMLFTLFINLSWIFFVIILVLFMANWVKDYLLSIKISKFGEAFKNV